jgi:hypothetical protein
MALDLAFRALMERSITVLMPLFVVYAIVYELGLTIETVGYSVSRLLSTSGDPLSLSEMLVRSRIRWTVREIRSKVSPQDYQGARNKAVAMVRSGVSDHSIFISGKDYLVPLVHMHLRRVARLNDSPSRFKVRLAQHCELEPGLSAAILNAAS